jgi:hypothetical protein
MNSSPNAAKSHRKNASWSFNTSSLIDMSSIQISDEDTKHRDLPCLTRVSKKYLRLSLPK